MVGDGQCCKLFVFRSVRRSACGDIRQSGQLAYLLSPHADRHAGDISFTVCLFRPPGPAFLISPPFQRPTPSRCPPILHQQWAPGCAHKISTDMRPTMPPFLTSEENVPNFGPNYDPNHLRTAVFLNCGTISETKNKLGKYQ